VKITKRRLQRIIREEKQKLLKENWGDKLKLDSQAIYDALEVLVVNASPDAIGTWRPDQWLDFKDLVDNAMHELKNRVVKEESEEDRYHRERSDQHKKDW